MSVDLMTRDDCAIVTLNRPQALNALSFDILRSIGQVFDAVAKTRARALSVTGAGDQAYLISTSRSCAIAILWRKRKAPSSIDYRCHRSPLSMAMP